MSDKKKRATTRWLYHVPFKGGTYIKIGRVHNQVEVPEDIIRYQVESNTPGGSFDFSCTVDEAAAIAAGLNFVVAVELVKDSQHVRKRYR